MMADRKMCLASAVQCPGFSGQGSVSRVQWSGFSVQGSVSKVQCPGFSGQANKNSWIQKTYKLNLVMALSL